MGACSICSRFHDSRHFTMESDKAANEAKKLHAYMKTLADAGVMPREKLPYVVSPDTVPVFLATHHVSYRTVDPKILFQMHTWSSQVFRHFTKHTRKKLFHALPSDEVFRLFHLLILQDHSLLTDQLLNDYRSARLTHDLTPPLALAMVAGL